jgi:hypothetical protein
MPNENTCDRATVRVTSLESKLPLFRDNYSRTEGV